MIKTSELIDSIANFTNLPQKEQVKLIAFFYCVENNIHFFNTSDIKNEFSNQHLPCPSNISSEISRLKKEKILISTKDGYSFNRPVKIKMEKQYIWSHHIRETNNTLENLSTNINNPFQKNFLEEAIRCFNVKSFRASIIMTWLLCMDTLYDFVINTELNLNSFNQSLENLWKYKKLRIIKKEDFYAIKESDFIELLKSAQIITNDIRKILDEKLWIRNSCAHPNNIIIEDYKAISFIQDIVKNVIEKYQK